MLEALAELGAAVVAVDVRRGPADETAARLHLQHGVETMAVVSDLERADDIAAVVPAIVKRLGRLDILVNNAALVGTSDLQGWAVPFEEQSIDTWRRAIDVNLTAAFALTQSAAAALTASGHGVVINIGSIYGIVGPDWRLYEGTPLGNPAAYAAS